jgi:4-amino-4-deoxy-L-arabinose transferase-like glycosyltransferase
VQLDTAEPVLPRKDALRLPTVRTQSGLGALLRSEAGLLAVILSFALSARLLWVFVTGWEPTPDDDAFRYDFAARALADGRGYVHLDGTPTAFWPPGYPLLLSAAYVLFGETVRAAQLVNVALGTATVALVYLIGRRTLGPAAALIAASIVAAFPSLIFFTGVTLSEIAFTFLALLGVYLLLVEAQTHTVGARVTGSYSRGLKPAASARDGEAAGFIPQITNIFPPALNLRLLLAAGLVLGLASLVRGQALLLPLVLVPFWLRSGVAWRLVGRRLVAVALGLGLIVAPWTVRNAIEMDAPVLIATNAGVDFWIGHHDNATGDFGAFGSSELVYRYPELTPTEREVRVNTDGFREGLTYAVTHPAQELALPFKKLFYLYYNDEEGLKWNEGHGGQRFLAGPVREALLSLSNVYYFAVLGLVVLGIPLWASRRDPGRLLLISLLAYWTLIHLVFFADPRFHAPILPIAALLAALPLATLWSDGGETAGVPH